MKYRIKKNMEIILLSSLLLIFINHGEAISDIYYVAKSGNDANQGTQYSPWLTIQKGMSRANAGDTVIVAEGIYNEDVTSVANGSEGSYITLQGAGAATNVKSIKITNNYNRISGMKISGKSVSGIPHYHKIAVTGNNNWIDNNTIYGNLTDDGVVGLWLGGSYNIAEYNTFDNMGYVHTTLSGNNNTIRYNIYKNGTADATYIFGHDHLIYRNEYYNIQDSGRLHADIWQTTGDGGAISYNILIDSNYVHDSTAQICNLSADGGADVRNWTFRNNVFANVSQTGNIYMPYVKFYNNTFYKCVNNGGAVLEFRYLPGSGNVANYAEVKNNMFIGCGASDGDGDNYGWYWFESGIVGSSADYNYVAKGPAKSFAAKFFFNGAEPHGINGGDPKFKNIGFLDFHLQLGSAAINKGTTINSFSHDKEGTQRPQGPAWDIGAYEYKSGFSLGTPSNFRVSN